MRPYIAVAIAVADSLAVFAVVAYGASATQVADKGTVIFSLFFYLTVVMVILAKLGVWAWVISSCIHEERDERKDTKYEYRYRDGLIIPDMDRVK